MLNAPPETVTIDWPMLATIDLPFNESALDDE